MASHSTVTHSHRPTSQPKPKLAVGTSGEEGGPKAKKDTPTKNPIKQNQRKFNNMETVKPKNAHSNEKQLIKSPRVSDKGKTTVKEKSVGTPTSERKETTTNNITPKKKLSKSPKKHSPPKSSSPSKVVKKNRSMGNNLPGDSRVRKSLPSNFSTLSKLYGNPNDDSYESIKELAMKKSKPKKVEPSKSKRSALVRKKPKNDKSNLVSNKQWLNEKNFIHAFLDKNPKKGVTQSEMLISKTDSDKEHLDQKDETELNKDTFIVSNVEYSESDSGEDTFEYPCVVSNRGIKSLGIPPRRSMGGRHRSSSPINHTPKTFLIYDSPTLPGTEKRITDVPKKKPLWKPKQSEMENALIKEFDFALSLGDNVNNNNAGSEGENAQDVSPPLERYEVEETRRQKTGSKYNFEKNQDGKISHVLKEHCDRILGVEQLDLDLLQMKLEMLSKKFLEEGNDVNDDAHSQAGAASEDDDLQQYGVVESLIGEVYSQRNKAAADVAGNVVDALNACHIKKHSQETSKGGSSLVSEFWHTNSK